MACPCLQTKKGEPAKKAVMEEFENAVEHSLHYMAPVVLANPRTFPNGMDSVRVSYDNEKKQGDAYGDYIGIDLKAISEGPPTYSSELHRVSVVGGERCVYVPLCNDSTAALSEFAKLHCTHCTHCCRRSSTRMAAQRTCGGRGSWRTHATRGRISGRYSSGLGRRPTPSRSCRRISTASP